SDTKILRNKVLRLQFSPDYEHLLFEYTHYQGLSFLET
ncbi:MAG: hypothetical protein QG594_1877, partial [Bacteroidota bacterium]|nr:hypothetical protein [Bacteroidota bacterium]